MSGCLHMSGMYTERHNVGGPILLKALLKGGRGSDVVMHDIGHAADAALMQHAPTSGGSFSTRIPEWVYTKGRSQNPNGVEEKSKWDKYRPGILILHCFAVRPAQTRRIPRHTPAHLPRQCINDSTLVLRSACDLLPRVASVTLPLPGLLLRMQVHNADFCELHTAVVLVNAQPDLVLAD
jgi:hypothetical protein